MGKAITGDPGSTWTNTTGTVRYQLLVSWENSCGLCIQHDHQVAASWPIPFHRGCNCRQVAIWPGHESAPFVDYRAKILTISRAQQVRVMGASNLILVEKGVVKWSDVVTETRVRSLQEVVSRTKLTVKEMTGAGVRKDLATKAYESVHTPAHELAERTRKDLLRKIREAGLSHGQVEEVVGKELAARASIGAGPPPREGPEAPPVMPTGPGRGPSPLVANREFVPSPAAKDAGEVTVRVDVGALDAAWSRDRGYAIPPEGGGAAIPGRMAAFRRFLEANPDAPIEQGRVTVDPDGTVSFTDGRHRFALLRDLGMAEVPISVPREQVGLARELFGVFESIRRRLGLK